MFKTSTMPPMTTANLNNTMSQPTHCNRCAERMRDADDRAESVEQDSMCISCRKHLAQCAEEEATASFCHGMTNPMECWFTDIITKAGIVYSCRIPEDINEQCQMLVYTGPNGLALNFDRNWKTIVLMKVNPFFPSSPEWGITFGLSTPTTLILETIKNAVSAS